MIADKLSCLSGLAARVLGDLSRRDDGEVPVVPRACFEKWPHLARPGVSFVTLGTKGPLSQIEILSSWKSAVAPESDLDLCYTD
jgi:hypothetical protein